MVVFFKEIGVRLAPIGGEAPYGAGDTPRFTVRTATPPREPVPALSNPLIDPAVRPNTAGSGIQIVRPDGDLAMSAEDGDWAAVAAYLGRFT